MKKQRNGVCHLAARFLVAFSVLLFITGVLPAQETSSSAAESFTLQYKDSGFNQGVGADVLEDDQKFEKEPDFGDRSIARAILRSGGEEKYNTGIIWDKAEGKLYIDLNRNNDLTDDTDGVFESERPGNYQHFRDIHIKGACEKDLEYVIDMNIYKFGGDNVNVNLTVKSGFQGEIELDGRKWHLAVVDNLDGKISGGDSIFLDLVEGGIGGGSVDHRLNLQVAELLTFGGKSYQPSFKFDSGQDSQTLEVEFTQVEKPQGQLKLEGKFINRLTLSSGSSTVLLYSPEDTVSVPVGSYHCKGVFLDGGEAGMFTTEIRHHPTVKITQDQPATLKVGGPLVNSVKVEPFGSTLRLKYLLTDSAGNEYESFSGRSENPPVLIVKKDGKEIASGDFEYG